ncbi:hypothetical protein [Pseudonocardia asaccharolytica]|uniref:hypothetical protein n=1 Tax=Pseudonocardia asaccharolytica TaxID=54010 RepID=UPI00041FFBC7|nr:hypothetical protein [Pseudonocardia asaccharolytica]
MPASGRPAGPDEDPQAAVARARAHVMGGHGPGASTSETGRYQRERPTLGPLPAPLERERVHLQGVRFRSRTQPGIDPDVIENQVDRWREIWTSGRHVDPRPAAVERPSDSGLPGRSAPGGGYPRHRPPTAPDGPLRDLLAGALAGAVLGILYGRRR